MLHQPVESKAYQRFGVGSVAEHLRCPLCSQLFRDAVLTPCCGETFCRLCVASRLYHCDGSAVVVAASGGSIAAATADNDSAATASSTTSENNSSSGKCPACSEVINSVDDLESNKVIQDAVEGVLRVGRLPAPQQHPSSSSTTSSVVVPSPTNNKIDDRNVVVKDEKTAGAAPVPPGTIRQVELPAGHMKPIPLGTRLKRSMTASADIEPKSKKQLVK